MDRTQWREAYSIVEDRILRLETEAGSTPFFGKGVVLKDKLLIQRASNLEIYNRTDGKLIFKSDDIENLKDICVLSKYKVACLCGNKIAIWYMDSTDNLKLIKTFDLRAEFEFGCDSVAKWNSDKLIVSGKKYINEINGMVFWCIVSIKNESIDSIHDICGVRYYDGVTNVAVKHNNIFVSVHSYTSGTQLEGVYAFDALNPRKLMFLYQHNELVEPWTIMADKNYVYVFNYGSQNVHQVTHSGYLETIHKLSSSFDKIFYDDKHEDFYTTKNKSNVITVYKNIISRCRKEYPQESGIPVEILNMGDKSIQLFEDALKEGKEAIYNIRIMVVGHMGVGKTTLVKRLLGENVNISKRLTTEGIDIHVNCCDISLSNKTWMRKEKGSENDFKLQRIAKIVNSHYKSSGGIVEQESYDISLPKENPRQNQGDIVVNDDKNITNQNQLSQHCIDQDLSSTTLYQRRTTSTDDKGSYSKSSESMMTVKEATMIRAPEFYKTNPLREMLQLLKENQNKDTLDERKDACLTIWDFAGQCAFYTTHQMFLSRRAIYLLVADVSGQIDDDVKDDSYFDIRNFKCQVKELVNIWMNSIHSIATCEADDLNSASSSTTSSTAIAPPVILVGTHIDQIQTRRAVTKPSMGYDHIEGRITKEDIINSINQSVICENPNMLYQVLNKLNADDFYSRSSLESNCHRICLHIPEEGPVNGNCFFEAVSQQLQRLNCTVQKSAEELRQDAVHFLKDNQELQVSTGRINFAESICNESFDEYCMRMEQDGEWADEVMVIAMARALQRDIMVVTSLHSSRSASNIALVIGYNKFWKGTILLGHIREHQYESLERKDSGLKSKQWRRLVAKMKLEAMKRMHECRKRGEEYLSEIRTYLADKPVVCHLFDEDFAIDNSVVDRRLEDLKMKIVEVASKQPYWGEQIPSRWFFLEQQLMSLRDDGLKVISHKDVEEINKRGTVQIKKSAELELFLKYLHETGTIIYFSIEILREHIILDPKWLMYALKTIINAHSNLPKCPNENGSTSSIGNVYQPDISTDSNAGSNSQSDIYADTAIIEKWSSFKEKGILSLELVDAIWTQDTHPELYRFKQYILKLMEQLNIIAKPRTFSAIGHKEEDYYLVPCILRQESNKKFPLLEQDSPMEHTLVLCCVFRGKYLPPPIFHRLVAACITRWPVAKNKATKENLIFCGCCIFYIDLFHRLTLHVKNHIIYARITRMGIDDKKTLDGKLCSRVRRFITANLTSITSYLGHTLQFNLCTMCPKSEGVSRDDNHHLTPPFDMWFADEGHDSDMAIKAEHMNYARLCVALVTVCGKAMREILRTQVPKQYTDIFQAILVNQVNLTSRQGSRKPLLNQDQIQLVFPNAIGRMTGTLEEFDVSLLYILIRNISSVQAPTTGWGNNTQDEPSRDTSLGANVERIRSYRNLINGHSADGEIQQEEFIDYWTKIDAVLRDIEDEFKKKDLVGHTYRHDLEKQRQQVISIHEAC